jgi:exopolysaccharide biosynthesis predicted pyruvyltransferase EpsI
LEAYSLKLAKELNLQPVNNKFCTSVLGFAEWDRVSIAEWVKNIAEAKFVITRSFHGMVFSILHKRQFAVLAGSHGRSTRLTSLLKILGIEDRFFSSIEDLNNAKPWTKEIDYTTVYPKLIEIREQSINILKKSIGL